MGQVKPQGPDDEYIHEIHYSIWLAGPACMARAGDCKRAWEMMNESMHPIIQEQFDKPADRGGGDPYRRVIFGQITNELCEAPN